MVMNRAKLTVFFVLLVVVVGAGAWSWINLVAAPAYDPAQAQDYLRHFDVRCNAEQPEQVCRDAIGYHHRRCFEETLQEGAEEGRLDGDRAAYLACMEQATAKVLSK
jgi:hypothetical protein